MSISYYFVEYSLDIINNARSSAKNLVDWLFDCLVIIYLLQKYEYG